MALQQKRRRDLMKFRRDTNTHGLSGIAVLLMLAGIFVMIAFSSHSGFGIGFVIVLMGISIPRWHHSRKEGVV